jgi:mannosyltransferase OCH1-like enzyme
MIPKKIFQTWKTREVENHVMKKWQQSWKDLNPDYEYVIWDDNDNRKFTSEHFSDFLNIYDNYSQNICRVDSIRYMYLYIIGGIYADLDFQCLKSFDPILTSMEENNIDVTLGSLSEMDDPKYSVHDIPNAIMISKPKCDFWLFVINALKNTKNLNLDPETQTGPIFLKLCFQVYMNCQYDAESIIRIYGADIFKNLKTNEDTVINITEPKILYPINWGRMEDVEKYCTKVHTNDELNVFFPESYAVTFWMHSW